jgi:hypothetical protein
VKSRAATRAAVSSRLRPLWPWSGVVAGVCLVAAGVLGFILGVTAHEDLRGDISLLAGAGIFLGFFGAACGATLVMISVGEVRRQRRRR